MREELDKALCRDFPILFQQRGLSPQETCMCWGFPGDGWEPLIRRCAEKVEAINRTLPPDQAIVASQVKEKFGTLRFYINGCPDVDNIPSIVDQAIRDAEDESCVTCEDCGAPGKQHGGRWIMTLCDACNSKKH